MTYKCGELPCRLKSSPFPSASAGLPRPSGRCEHQVDHLCRSWLDTRGGRAASKETPQNKRKNEKLTHKNVIASEAKSPHIVVNHSALPRGQGGRAPGPTPGGPPLPSAPSGSQRPTSSGKDPFPPGDPRRARGTESGVPGIPRASAPRSSRATAPPVTPPPRPRPLTRRGGTGRATNPRLRRGCRCSSAGRSRGGGAPAGCSRRERGAGKLPRGWEVEKEPRPSPAVQPAPFPSCRPVPGVACGQTCPAPAGLVPTASHRRDWRGGCPPPPRPVGSGGKAGGHFHGDGAGAARFRRGTLLRAGSGARAPAALSGAVGPAVSESGVCPLPSPSPAAPPGASAARAPCRGAGKVLRRGAAGRPRPPGRLLGGRSPSAAPAERCYGTRPSPRGEQGEAASGCPCAGGGGGARSPRAAGVLLRPAVTAPAPLLPARHACPRPHLAEHGAGEGRGEPPPCHSLSQPPPHRRSPVSDGHGAAPQLAAPEGCGHRAPRHR